MASLRNSQAGFYHNLSGAASLQQRHHSVNASVVGMHNFSKAALHELEIFKLAIKNIPYNELQSNFTTLLNKEKDQSA